MTRTSNGASDDAAGVNVRPTSVGSVCRRDIFDYEGVRWSGNSGNGIGGRERERGDGSSCDG